MMVSYEKRKVKKTTGKWEMFSEARRNVAR
ncbi:hypothetical protein QWA68_004963 [Fusarium oxysporum]|nr:hypothetical protein QWA68_004963 [Fusarium oxysporum]